MINQLETSYTPRRETSNLVKDVVQAAFDTVASTMGPNGELALIIDVNQPVVTKDGVRVAKALDFNDIRKNSIAKLITSAAIKTDEIVGDGTTTTVLMVHSLYQQFNKDMNFHISRIVDELVDETKVYLESLVQEITPNDFRFERMVKTTANYQNDIADTVIQMFLDYKNPNVTLKRGNGNVEDIVECNNNVFFEGRYATPQLQWGTPRGEVKVEDSRVVIINNDIRELSPNTTNLLASFLVESGGRPLYVMARSFDPQTHDAFIRINQHVTKLLGVQGLYIIPISINSPGSLAAETINDLGKLVNVTPYNDIDSIEKTDLENNLVDSPFKIDISGVYFDRSKSDEHDERAKEILDRLIPLYEGMNFTEKASYIGKFLFTRISRLLAENVTVIVSGMTKAEISERYYLFEDAFRVAASSIRFGVLPGIGWGYNQVAEMLHAKYSHLNDSPSETDRVMYVATSKYIKALLSQYEYITNKTYVFGSTNTYFDLVTLEETDEPTHVFDNGSSAIVALEGGWSVVKRLCKLSCILGKSNTSYQM